MNIKKFLRDRRTGRSDYNTAEAANFLQIKPESLRHLIRAGVIRPIDGGGRGRVRYFSFEQLDQLRDELNPYR